MTNFDTGNSWDTGVGDSHDVLKDVTNSPTRVSEDDAGWAKPPKHDDVDSQKATWSHDEGTNTGGASGKTAGGCFRCGAEDHMKSDCPEKPAGGCFRCVSDKHMKVDCPEPPKPMGECFNCGEVGHSKTGCTKEKVARPFTDTCNLCQEEGHRASQCPTAPARLYKNCEEPETDSHSAATCTNRRKIHRGPDKDSQADEAWKAIVAMTQPGSYWDMEDLRVPFERYTDAIPDATYVQLENAFRDNNLTVYIIAADKQFTNTYTLVDLQGNIDREYAVWFRKGPKPTRPYEEEFWPATKKDNLQRLITAGEVQERGAIRCNGCGDLGHTRKNCKDSGPPVIPQGSIEHCLNCNEDGHRLRNCPKPREDKNACRNCKQSGHQSRDCPVPRSLNTIGSNNCNEMGHYSRDCPTGGGGGSGCFNCDSTEHQSKECPAPRDYSRVKSNTCGEMGHTASRCKPASTSEDVGEFGVASNSWDHSSGGASSSAPAPTKTSSSGWIKVSEGDVAAEDHVAVASDGGWGNSSTSHDTAPASPATSSDARPAQLFPEVNVNHGADIAYSAYSRDYAPRHETSIGGDSPWAEKGPTTAAPRVDQPAADKVVAVKTVAKKNVADETGADKTVADNVVAAKPAAGLWVKADTSKTVADKSVADKSVGGLWGKTGANNTATKNTAVDSTVANNTAANNTVANEPAAGPWDPWGIPATIGVVDETTGTDRNPQSTGSPFVAAYNMNPSGGPAALKPLFLDDGRNRHNSDLASYIPVPYTTRPRMAPSASSRDEREDDDIPRAGGFGGGASSPENDDTIRPETTTSLAIRSTAPRFAYQPSRGPGPNTSAPRQQKSSGPPYGVSVVFPSVKRVSRAPIVPQPGFVGRPRTHTMVQPARPLMAPQFTTPSFASNSTPSHSTPSPVVTQGMAPGGSVGRPHRESIVQSARPMTIPHRAAPSPPSTTIPSPVVTQGVAPAELVSRPRRGSIIQPVRPIVTPRLTSPSAAVNGSPMPVVAQGVMSGGGRQRSQTTTQPANPFVQPQMAAGSTANAAVPAQMSTPPRPSVSPDFPFRDMEHLERTPPPHGLDVFFDGESSESAVVDDELPTPTQATFPTNALAPPEESW